MEDFTKKLARGTLPGDKGEKQRKINYAVYGRLAGSDTNFSTLLFGAGYKIPETGLISLPMDKNKRILADPDLQANAEHVIKNVHPDYFVQDESALEMKSPIKQVTVEGTPTTIKQSLGFLEGDSEGSEKSEERKKYMTNKEYYKLYPELKPDPKDTMFRDVDEDGNVITRGLGWIGRGLGKIKLKGGGRGGYETGPGGGGGWRG